VRERKLVFLLWTVIVVLVVGGVIGGFLLAHKVDELSQDNFDLNGSNDSLRNQLKQAKASPTPSDAPVVSPSESPSASPSATPAATATPTPTPAKTPAPKR
jgi:outer membrane murein-binding lipoprotein Lpp